MITQPTIILTLHIEQQSHTLGFKGYIEEIPNLVWVEGSTMRDVQVDLYTQVAQLISELPDLQIIRIKTRIIFWYCLDCH
ncbi:MAG: hypothetical protein V4714_22520 [Bacteroidota bacterium]